MGLLEGGLLTGVESNVPWSISVGTMVGYGPVGGADVIGKDTW
jgi:hypothetical protein